MQCVADYYDGKNSKKQRVLLKIDQKNVLTLVTNQGEKNYSIHEIVVSPRLGGTSRRIEMSDGAVCEVSDNDAIDAFLKLSSGQVPGSLVYKLESKFRYCIIAIVIMSLIVWGTISYGIPSAAKHIAFRIPVTANSVLGQDVLAVLDKTIFSESELSDSEAKEASELFSKMIAPLENEYRFSFELRKSPNLGANAFALPTGTIVATDELVQLVDDPHELEAILAHEVGHVVYRHSLRKMLQGSAIAVIMMAVTGDISTATMLAGSLPTLLTETYYSREFEREADRYAYEHLTSKGIPPIHFANILIRISDSGKNIGFLSSHPSPEERLRMFSE